MAKDRLLKSVRYFLLLPMILTLLSCGSGGDSGGDSDSGGSGIEASTELTINAVINDTIPSFGTKVYRFKTIDAGNYTISLTNLISDLGWSLLSYDPADTNINDLFDNIIDVTNGDIYFGTVDEVYTQVLQSDTYYYVVVDEYDDNGSSNYSLQILY